MTELVAAAAAVTATTFTVAVVMTMVVAVTTAAAIIAVDHAVLGQRLCLGSGCDAESQGKPQNQSGGESSGARYESHSNFPRP